VRESRVIMHDNYMYDLFKFFLNHSDKFCWKTVFRILYIYKHN